MSNKKFEKILEDIKVAQEQWKTGKIVNKPEVLLLGPKPLKKKLKEEDPKYPIFPVQNTRVRGRSYSGTRKIRLVILENQIESIKEKITSENNNKEKEYLTQKLKELKLKFDIILQEIREYKKLKKQKDKERKRNSNNN